MGSLRRLVPPVQPAARSEMRIALFDWTVEGHHELYVWRIAEALRARFDVVAVVPEALADSLAAAGIEVLALPDARPPIDPERPVPAQYRELAAAELDRMDAVVGRLRPDHVVHLFADRLLREWVGRPSCGAPVTACVFYPAWHYRSLFGTPMTPREVTRARFYQALLAIWRRRGDAHAVFCLDEEATRLLHGSRGAPVHWLPEPPVPSSLLAPPRPARDGCVVYGQLAERKGIGLLSDAVTAGPTPVRVTLAGAVEAGFEKGLDAYVAAMHGAGAEVDLRAWPHSEQEGLRVLAGGECAVVAYPHHHGMSRVVLEAASVGTPVIAHDRGLIGHLVKKHRLGLALDCTDAGALRSALLTLGKPGAAQEYEERLARFAAMYDARRFEEAVSAPFARP